MDVDQKQGKKMIGWILIILYALLIFISIAGVINLPETKLDNQPAENDFSIIVAFKNEQKNLPVLLTSLKNLNYPKSLFEIIMVNDHSGDNFEKIKKQHPEILWINNRGNGKKEALETGIEKSSKTWIITTDADCKIPENWLIYFDQVIRNQASKMILGPVKYFERNDLLARFQQFEFLSLQAFTMAGIALKNPFLANGAALGFEKKAYQEVNGYEGNRQLASGDDIFLLEKFQKRFKGQIHFIKNSEAVVLTRCQNSLPAMLQQKIRWSSKTKYQKNIWAKITGLIVTLTNIYLIVAWILIWKDPDYLKFIIGKFLLDAGLFLSVKTFYGVKFNLFQFFLSYIIYPFYFIYVLIKSLTGKYIWKETSYSI